MFLLFLVSLSLLSPGLLVQGDHSGQESFASGDPNLSNSENLGNKSENFKWETTYNASYARLFPLPDDVATPTAPDDLTESTTPSITVKWRQNPLGPDCTSETDCFKDGVCYLGACFCPSGAELVNDACVAKHCTHDTDCPPGLRQYAFLVCQDGACVCEEDFELDSQKLRCLPKDQPFWSPKIKVLAVIVNDVIAALFIMCFCCICCIGCAGGRCTLGRKFSR